MHVTLPKVIYGIEEFEQAVHPDLCTRAIAFFEATQPNEPEVTDRRGTSDGRDYSVTDLTLPEETYADHRLVQMILRRIRGCVDDYLDEYVGSSLIAQQIKDGIYSLDPRMKRYDPGDDFPLHTDDSSVLAYARKFAYILYLNEDFQGGETVFRTAKQELYRVVPRTGTVAVFPVNPIYMHKGEAIVSGRKYILNGFVNVLMSQLHVHCQGQGELPKTIVLRAECLTLGERLAKQAEKVCSSK